MSEETTTEKPLPIRGANQTSNYADATALVAKFDHSIVEIIESLGEITVVVKAEVIVPLMMFLRSEPPFDFNFLSDVSGLDLGEFATPRFAVAYHLYSIKHNHRLRIKVFLDEENPQVETISEVWRSANWMEREIYDMFGIDFINHPDLRRILMPADYEGHPLRKDFPVRGY
jgi:NADH-quinone oxidoreductase subunit C